jgi:hypothetical protein
LSDALQPPSRSITFLTTAKTAARKIDAILNLSRPMQAVQALDAREFHALIQTAGLDQSMELIELASGEQVQALIDFDGWNRDRLEHKRFADWMMILLGCPDESLHRWFAKLDLEPIIVWMREHAQVFLWEEDRDLLDCVDAPVLTSPDGTYAIMVPDDGEPADIVRMLLDRAYAYDLDYGRRLLEASVTPGSKTSASSAWTMPPPFTPASICRPGPQHSGASSMPAESSSRLRSERSPPSISRHAGMR